MHEDKLKVLFSRVALPKNQSDCWEWTGSKLKAGYGKLSLNSKKYLAHRVSLEIKIGRSLVDGEYAMHKCDNPSCVNPEHLVAGTPKQNTFDMLKKGRHPIVKLGECRFGHKLTEDNVYTYSSGYRCCKLCHRDRQSKNRAARKLLARFEP